ncbi:integral membrane protein [Fusarium pseudocircinatum]|uniref:aldehyde dehydrogenase (NAD(+)) n=1 Tax=Fusarium pseudocircinatum TaxID=56676 RepID=A0A8H5PW41_9HYPO|nr:integral membrane protein [Fusarium pseudocircinatum]
MASVQPPNPLPPDQNVGPILLGISGTCLALVIITTSVRIWVRTALRSSGWDDYTIVIVTLLGIARYGVQVGQVSIGNGRHRWYIEPEDYVQNNKLGWVAQILLFASICLLKISILLLLLRIKDSRSVRPVSAYWTGVGECWNPRIRIYYIYATIGMYSGVATGFGIARATSLGVVTSDLSWVYAITAIWSNLELYLGIVGANLALSRSIFAYFFREGGTTKGSSYGGMPRSTSASRNLRVPSSSGFRSGQSRIQSRDQDSEISLVQTTKKQPTRVRILFSRWTNPQSVKTIDKSAVTDHQRQTGGMVSIGVNNVVLTHKNRIEPTPQAVIRAQPQLVRAATAPATMFAKSDVSSDRQTWPRMSASNARQEFIVLSFITYMFCLRPSQRFPRSRRHPDPSAPKTLTPQSTEKAFPAWKKTHPENAEAIVALTTLILGAPKSTTRTIQTSSAPLSYFAGCFDKVHGESWPAADGYVSPSESSHGTPHSHWQSTKHPPPSQQGTAASANPPKKTPLTTLPTAAGFPPGVFQILIGDDSTVSLLSHHMHVKKVCSTGSVPIRKKILAAEPLAGLLVSPTTFIGIVEESDIATEEIFGPVSVITKFKDEDEVIARANNSEYGLAAGVFTRYINGALRVAGEFEARMFGINYISRLSLNTTFGGHKEYELGRQCGRVGLTSWMQTKTVIINMT